MEKLSGAELITEYKKVKLALLEKGARWEMMQHRTPPEPKRFSVDEPIPPKPELISGLLRVGKTAIISAPSKSGKTWTALYLSICLAMGARWFGYKCRKSRVFYINYELDDADFYERIEKAAANMGFTDSLDEVLANLIVWTTTGYDPEPIDILDQVTRFEPDFVVVDSLYNAFHGNESDNQEANGFMSGIKAIACETNASILLVHHTPKGSGIKKAEIDRHSGASVWARSPDLVMGLLPVPADIESARMKAGLESVRAGYVLTFTTRGYDKPQPLPLWRIVGECGGVDFVVDETHLIFDALDIAREGGNAKRKAETNKRNAAKEAAIEAAVKVLAPCNGDMFTYTQLAKEANLDSGSGSGDRKLMRNWLEDSAEFEMIKDGVRKPWTRVSGGADREPEQEQLSV